MREITPETRPQAPGDLGVLQEFVNSGHLNATALVRGDVREEIRGRHERGDSQSLLASEFGLNQGFISAILRRAPLDDELGSPADAAAWLEGHRLAAAGTVVRAEDLIQLLEFRELLRAMAAANNGHALEPDVLAALNAIAASAPLVVRFESASELALHPPAGGVAAALGRLLAMLVTSMRDGSWQRLKRCPGNGCPFTFYDSSRNRTGTWCAMSICGNRTKVRKYQQRRRLARTV